MGGYKVEMFLGMVVWLRLFPWYQTVGQAKQCPICGNVSTVASIVARLQWTSRQSHLCLEDFGTYNLNFAVSSILRLQARISLQTEHFHPHHSRKAKAHAHESKQDIAVQDTNNGDKEIYEYGDNRHTRTRPGGEKTRENSSGAV